MKPSPSKCWPLICLLLPLTAPAVHCLPCCPDDGPMVQENGTALCYPNLTLATIYNFCARFYILDLTNPTDADAFYENDNRTAFSHDQREYFDTYCTGYFKNGSFAENHPWANQTEKPLVLICFPEPPAEGHLVLYGTCLFISSMFLLATLIIYLILPELRDLQGNCTFYFILSLMVGYLSLSSLHIPFTTPGSHEDTRCIIMAFFTYFWMLSAFFWLNLNSFNMWRSVALAHVRVSESRLMVCYHLYGWGMPSLFLAVALITHHLPEAYIRPNFGVYSCWFNGIVELWSFFYGPVLVVIILNIGFFISTACYLWSDYRNPNPMPRIKSLRTKFGIYFKLFLIMGITWIFEILSVLDGEPWYVTDVLNSLQGLIIFVVMVLLRKRVWRALAKNGICGNRFARYWQRLDDEETQQEGEMDEM